MKDNGASRRDRRPGAGRIRLAMAVGAVAGLVAASRLATRRRMPNAAAWQRALAAARGDAEAARLITAAQSRYERLRTDAARPASRALRIHLSQFILPGLALYQTLLDSGSHQQAALAEMEQLLGMRIRPRLWLVDTLRFFPDPFPILRRATLATMRVGFPPEGWAMEMVPSTPDCFGFDIHRCFYLDTLTALGAPELTRVYCAGDDILFAALPPSIVWDRSGTLARGQDRCDFRWRRDHKRGAPDPAPDPS